MVQDGDARDRVEPVRGEVLDVVELGELAASVRRDEVLELKARPLLRIRYGGEGLAVRNGTVLQEEEWVDHFAGTFLRGWHGRVRKAESGNADKLKAAVTQPRARPGFQTLTS